MSRARCPKCSSLLKLTERGRKGKGPLTERKCPKCRVLFYSIRPSRLAEVKAWAASERSET
jgi:ssDNA-binding Zn-finger/Zn-ribbon topoisomerase 1